LKVKVGDRAPDFTLLSQRGENVTLSKLYGKKNIVLYFYPKDQSKGCTRQACEFRDKYEVFTDLGAEVIGISSDDVKSHKEFVKENNLPFILLSDNENKIRKLYGVKASFGLIPGRVTYIIDKNGIVKHIFSSQFQFKRHIEESLRTLKNLK
jgi:peroxiredoxin Q/BCP